MSVLSPLLGAALSLLNGAVFGYVGQLVRRRPLAGEERRANELFALFWYCLAALSGASVVFGLAAAVDFTDLATHEVVLMAAILLLCIGLWGLAYYLAYLFTGNARWFRRLAIFYTFYFLFILYLVIRAQPMGVTVERWQTTIQYAHQMNQQTPFVQALLLLVLFPQILGALAYMSLLPRVRNPLQRYRIAMVSGSILVWFASSILASLVRVHGLRLNEWAGWTPASRIIGLGAAVAVLLAFRPPAALQRELEARGRPYGGGVR